MSTKQPRKTGPREALCAPSFRSPDLKEAKELLDELERGRRI
jgi:hypothetical protein